MADRHIHCPFCEKKLAVPANWTADYAMTWFYTEHVREHAAEIIVRLQYLLVAAAMCAACRASLTNETPDHRACFAPDCHCVCSRVITPTTPEETARADG